MFVFVRWQGFLCPRPRPPSVLTSDILPTFVGCPLFRASYTDLYTANSVVLDLVRNVPGTIRAFVKTRCTTLLVPFAGHRNVLQCSENSKPPLHRTTHKPLDMDEKFNTTSSNIAAVGSQISLVLCVFKCVVGYVRQPQINLEEKTQPPLQHDQQIRFSTKLSV